mgnify:CR=1 FL=1
MNYKTAINLLRKYVKEEHVISHSKRVAEVAEKIAKTIKKNGHKINVEKVKCAALLHDIGRGIEHENHEYHSEEILRKEGQPDIADIIKTHGIRLERHGKEEFRPETLEQRIIAYADGRVNFDEVVTLKERYELLDKREKFRHSKEEMGLINKSWPRAKKNEEFLLDLAGKRKFDFE